MSSSLEIPAMHPALVRPTHSSTIRPSVLEACSQAYELLGRIFQRGVQTTELDTLRNMSELWAALPRRMDGIDLEAATADYYALFRMTVHAYEGVFVDPRAVIGATAGELFNRFAPRHVLASIEAPDHLGSELLLLASMCNAGDHRSATELLHRHLLRWIAPVSISIFAHADPFYAAATQLLNKIVAHHAEITFRTIQPVQMPVAWMPTDDHGLEGLLSALLTPILAGGLLTSHDLDSVAVEQGLPRLVGPRKVVLRNLITAAAQQDRTEHLLETLATRFDRMVTAYHHWKKKYSPLSPAAQPWVDRAEHTARQLRRLSRDVTSRDA